MSITNYAELQTAVARWLKRDDLTSYIPDYITFGETRLWHGDKGRFPTEPLRLKSMQTRATGSVASGSIALPTGYLETERLSIANYGGALRYLPPQQFAEKEENTSAPSYYTFLAGAIKVAGTGSASYIHDYYAKTTALSATDNTNALLTAYPELFLWAACIEGALDIVSDSMAQRFAGQLQGRINALQMTNKHSYAGGSLAVTVGR